ncbi:MAG: class I SAM-dependent methyltransferase [Thermoplasmata archaeon]|nr:class I SAM-dependent methyltransferase [Thermoplasmata archaeon]
MYVVPAAVRTPWASAALRRGAATITLPRGSPAQASAVLVLDPLEVEAVQQQFRRMHGEVVWARYFEGRPKVIALRPESPGAPRSEFELIRAEFDAVAPGYARAVSSDPNDSYLRERSIARLRTLFQGRDPILEIGCGTGSETIPLLNGGHRIVAVDISTGMLAQLRHRAAEVGAEDRLTTIEGRLADLGGAIGSLGAGAFAGAFSTFGAFNLERDLHSVGPALAKALVPGAPLFLGVLNRHALMPLVAAVGGGHWRELTARLRNPIPADSSRFPLDVYALRPAQVSRLLGADFRLEASEAASVFSPPDDLPRLRKAVGARGKLALRRLDHRLSRTRVGVELAEWQFLTYRRATLPAGRV